MFKGIQTLIKIGQQQRLRHTQSYTHLERNLIRQ
jgi:hypothetical protein